MIHLLTILAHLACVIAAITSQQPLQTNSNEPSILSSSLRERIDTLREKWGVKGISIGLAASPNSTIHTSGKDKWTLETMSFGEADRYGNKVDGDTMFAIASNSKLFTALSIGLLVENNTVLPNGERLEWSSKVKDILPEWKLKDRYASDHMDLIDLASMRSGMPRHDYIHGGESPAQVISFMRHLNPSTEFRQNWQYNNHHYFALALIVERLLQIPFQDYVKLHILDPIGMSSTTHNSTEALISGHRSDSFTRTGVNVTACWEGIDRRVDKLAASCLTEQGTFGWWTASDGLFEAGVGGVVTSGKDMAKWVKELLHPTVLPHSLVDKVTTTHTVMSGTADHLEYGVFTYGLAQWVYTYRGHAVHTHTGSVPGQHSRMLRIPSLGFGFMIAINDDNFGTLFQETIANMIVDEVLNLDPLDWEYKIAKQMFKIPLYPDAPEDPKPHVEHIEGIYHHASYGEVNLVEVHIPESKIDLPFSDLTLNAPLNITGPVFVAEIDKIFVTHLVFTHFDGPLFNWTGVYVADKLGKHDKVLGKLTQVVQVGTAVILDDGIGMFGNWWGKGSTVESSKVNLTQTKKHAEVWFEKR
ncbi:uncharacterized protein IL334_006296 [Kwoniella shivajii]|uniref:Beta-lactamase-related domain-containing protein n=1 Tax=Kwoniella shivajii TaxID=564305 RepID=A0ABZ1D9I2_9TREE|nr:hypothetical protein IL334_006296 [Kwoniella shivajii]